MSRGRLIFTRIVHDSAAGGTGAAATVSRVFFDLETASDRYLDLYADVRQAAGADPSRDPLEVDLPQGFLSPIDPRALRRHVEAFFREALGPGGGPARKPGRGNPAAKETVIRRTRTIEVVTI